MQLAKWALLLAGFWLLLSGYLQPLLLSFGVISVALVVYVLKRMNDVDQEPKAVASGLRIVPYLIWLFGQIAASSAHVSKLVWGKTSKLSPTLAQIPARKVPQDVRVLYANSITLTPGTLSVDLADGIVTVHALQKESIEELKQGAMEKKITSIWGENKV